MPIFFYKSVSADGSILQGELEATDQSAVIAQLHASGHTPIIAKPVSLRSADPLSWLKHLRKPRIRQAEIHIFTQELSCLLRAGLPLDTGLQVMISVTEDDVVRELTCRLQDSVQSGASFSAALEEQTGVFSRFYINMVRAAEEAGTLEVGLDRVVDYQKRSRMLRDRVLAALIYPSILVAVSAISLLIILAYVVPQFTQLFAEAGRALPTSTQIVISASEMLRDYWWIAGGGIAGICYVIFLQQKTKSGRLKLDRLLLHLPVVGPLIKKMDMARFSRSLGTLLSSGTTLLSGLSISRGILSNSVLSESLEDAIEGLKSGRSLADQMIAAGLFPNLGLKLLKVGEETGKLDQMLMEVAEIYDQEVSTAVQRILAMLEPLLIVGLGLLIGGIIMSILIAIISINDLPV